MEQQTEITAKLDTGELAEAWAKKKDAKPKYLLGVSLGAKTDLGRMRENNEDKFEFFQPEETEVLAVKGCLYAVADGMGGHASGQIASEMALKTLVKDYYADPNEDVAESLRKAVESANKYIHQASQAVIERSGMGTTCTAAAIRDDEMYIAQVGDSRLYIIRDGEISQITHDHSWVAEQVRLGALTEEEAEYSPFRNVITRSLGASPDVEVDIFNEKIQQDDVLILCSDGLTGCVSDHEILEIADTWSPAMAALKLVDRANEAGGGDNITVMVIAIKDLEKAKDRNRLKKLLGKS